MVGKPNEFRIDGSTGEGERNRGISFIGDSCRGMESPGFVADLPIPLLLVLSPVFGDLCDRFVIAPKKRDGSLSFDGDGRGGGPISDVDLARCGGCLSNVGDLGLELRVSEGVEGPAGEGRGELDLDPVRE